MSVAIVLSKSRALHQELVDEVNKSFSGTYGLTIVKNVPKTIGKAYLLDQFIDEFLTLDRLRSAIIKRGGTPVLYVLGEWNLSQDECDAFVTMEKDEDETMASFVSSLR